MVWYHVLQQEGLYGLHAGRRRVYTAYALHLISSNTVSYIQQYLGLHLRDPGDSHDGCEGSRAGSTQLIARRHGRPHSGVCHHPRSYLSSSRRSMARQRGHNILSITGTTTALSFGPAHPAAHGVLRATLYMHQELVVSCSISLGLLHRGTERLMEGRGILQADAIPGRANALTLCTTAPGTLYGQCSEICGALHGYMPITLSVES